MMEFDINLRKYVSNTGYLFLEKIFRSFFLLFVWARVVRYLGPEQFGIFSYALSFVSLFSILADVGLESVVVKKLVEREDLKDVILGSTLILRMGGALTAIFLVWSTTVLMNAKADLQAIIFLISLRFIFQAFDGINFFFRSRTHSKCVVFPQMISLFITVILCLVFINRGLGLIYFVFISVFETATLACGLVFFYVRSEGGLFDWHIDLTMLKTLLKASWPLIFSGIAISIFLRVDQVMIKIMIGAQAVGHYAAAVRVSEIFYFIPVIIIGSFFPAIVRSKTMGQKIYQARLEALFTALTWIAILTSVFLSFYADRIVQFLYGSEFHPASRTLIVLAWASVCVFLAVAKTQWAINENLQVYMLLYTSVGALMNVVLNYVFIPRYNIEGAAWATFISYFFSSVLCNAFSVKTREIFFIQVKSFNIFGGFWKKLLSPVIKEK